MAIAYSNSVKQLYTAITGFTLAIAIPAGAFVVVVLNGLLTGLTIGGKSLVQIYTTGAATQYIYTLANCPSASGIVGTLALGNVNIAVSVYTGAGLLTTTASSTRQVVSNVAGTLTKSLTTAAKNSWVVAAGFNEAGQQPTALSMNNTERRNTDGTGALLDILDVGDTNGASAKGSVVTYTLTVGAGGDTGSDTVSLWLGELALPTGGPLYMSA